MSSIEALIKAIICVACDDADESVIRELSILLAKEVERGARI